MVGCGEGTFQEITEENGILPEKNIEVLRSHPLPQTQTLKARRVNMCYSARKRTLVTLGK